MATQLPNLIYILADDMGYGDLSSLNPQGKIHTHHLDQLAAGGLICRDAHATSAVCTPSRYSILTGRYNWRSALKQGVNRGYSPRLIEDDRLTVAALLKQQGYRTGCVGKWHLGWHWAKTGPEETDVDFSQPITDGPTSVGFDYFFGISASLDMPPYVYVENEQPTAVPDHICEGFEGKRLLRAGPTAPDFVHEEVLPTFAEKALAWIDAQAQQDAPFFLYLPLAAPHTPILPTAEFLGKSGVSTYGDFCLQVDDVVGRIMALLDQHGIAENTIVIFTADNGCAPHADLAEMAAVGHNPSYLFRGHKADIYEGGHRIPLIVRWPATIAAGSVSDETVCLVDLLATCADIVEIALPDNAGEDSVSNLPLWRGAALDCALREATVHSSVDGSLSIRQGRWKLEMCPGSGGWSYPKPGPESAGLPPLQLYDLAADIGERMNVAANHPEVVESLTDLLTTYIRNGRSTPGAPQQNVQGAYWEQLWWLADA
jgi:arylsulfatase A-like enzyme